MRTSKYIMPALLLMAVSSNAQTLDQNITIEREYKPIIQDAGKITSLPEVIDPNIKKTEAQYTEFNLPLAVEQSIHTLSVAKVEMPKRTKTDEGFIRFGMGNYWNNMFDFALPIVKEPETKLDLKIDHLATFGTKKHSETNAALTFEHEFQNLSFYTGAQGGFEYFNYYGNNYNNDGDTANLSALSGNTSNYVEQDFESITRASKNVTLGDLARSAEDDALLRYNVFMGISSLPDETKANYLFEVRYKSFNSRNGLTENIIDSKARFETDLQDSRIGVDFDMQNMMYKSDSIPSFNFWGKYTVFCLNPYYNIKGKTWNVRLGMKASISFDQETNIYYSPDISAEWSAPKWISLYTGIGGGIEANTLDKMYRENRYLYPDVRVADTYTPFSPYLGLKVKPLHNLLVDAYINYRYIDNQYFFVNKAYATADTTVSAAESVIYTNRFNAIYSAASVVKIGTRINYSLYDRLNIELNGVYNKWEVATTEMAWNKPAFEASLNTDFFIKKNFNITTNIFFESEHSAKLGDMIITLGPDVNVNVGASYTYENWLTVFAKANNLLNHKHMCIYGYQTQGFNVMIGGAVSF